MRSLTRKENYGRGVEINRHSGRTLVNPMGAAGEVSLLDPAK